MLNVNSKIFSINSSNGIINWSYETVSENFKSLKSYNLMIVKNTLIFSNDNGDLIAINLIKNSILWSLNLRESSTIDQGKIFEIFDISVNSNYLYISLKNGYFYKINIVNGVVKWKKLIRLQSSPVFLEKTIIFINNNNYLIIADKYSGSILFSKNLNSQLKNNKVKKVITFNKVLALAKSLYLLSDNSDITFKINLSNLENFKIIELKPSIIDNFFIKNKNIFFTDKKNLINKITINDY